MCPVSAEFAGWKTVSWDDTCVQQGQMDPQISIPAEAEVVDLSSSPERSPPPPDAAERTLPKPLQADLPEQPAPSTANGQSESMLGTQLADGQSAAALAAVQHPGPSPGKRTLPASFTAHQQQQPKVRKLATGQPASGGSTMSQRLAKLTAFRKTTAAAQQQAKGEPQPAMQQVLPADARQATPEQKPATSGPSWSATGAADVAAAQQAAPLTLTHADLMPAALTSGAPASTSGQSFRSQPAAGPSQGLVHQPPRSHPSSSSAPSGAAVVPMQAAQPAGPRILPSFLAQLSAARMQYQQQQQQQQQFVPSPGMQQAGMGGWPGRQGPSRPFLHAPRPCADAQVPFDLPAPRRIPRACMSHVFHGVHWLQMKCACGKGGG